jgi:hypothetical protein
MVGRDGGRDIRGAMHRTDAPSSGMATVPHQRGHCRRGGDCCEVQLVKRDVVLPDKHSTILLVETELLILSDIVANWAGALVSQPVVCTRTAHG